MNGCYHQLVHVHTAKVDSISGVTDQLRKEYPLRPAVSLPERVKQVGIAIEFRDLFHKRVKVILSEIILLGQVSKNGVPRSLNFIRRDKLRSFLGQVDGADFTRPVISILEQEFVYRLIVGKIKVSLYWLLFQ